MKKQMLMSARGKRMTKSGGFTLVEMLLVLVILATLAAIVLPKLSGRAEQANQSAAKSQIAIFEGALDAYEVDNGEYPDTAEGLQALVDMPASADASKWRGPYLKNIPVDPWKSDYVYEYPGKLNASSYDVISGGKNKRVGDDDDITNADQAK